MSVSDEGRSKLQKILDEFTSEQEEYQLKYWIQQCFEKETTEALFLSLVNTEPCWDFFSLIKVVDKANSTSNPQVDFRNKTALSTKLSGNDYFRRKNFKCAALYYHIAIFIRPSDQELLVTLYNNLAAALFYLTFYCTSIKHCQLALEIKPMDEKALKCKALCEQKMKESFNAADSTTKRSQTLALCSSNELYVRLPNQISYSTEEKLNKLIETIQKRKYQFASSKINLSNLTPSNHYLKDHRVLLIQGQLIWPVCLSFPDFGRTFLIEQFRENWRLQAVICRLPPFNLDCSKYLSEFLQVYCRVKDNLIRIDMTKSLKEILSLENYVIQHGTPDFAVFVKGGKQEILFLEEQNGLD